MFDPLSMLVLGGGAIAGGGLGLAGGLIQGDAAQSAAGAQLGYLDLARSQVQQAQQQQLALLQPYQAFGSNALSFLQSRVLNSNERQMADVQRRSQLEAEIKRLSVQTDWASFPNLTGPKASERKAAMWQDIEFQRNQKLKEANQRLAAFDQEQKRLAPLRAEQERQLAAKEGRISSVLDRINNRADQISNIAPISASVNIPSSLAQLRAEMQKDEVFKFRQEEGERAINRAAAQRGQFFSGAAIGSLSDFNMKLSGEETDKYFNRVLEQYDRSLQTDVARFNSQLGTATAALGADQATLNAEMGFQQQGINNLFGLSNLGLQAATTGANVLGTNAQTQANIYSQQGQAEAAGIQGKAAGLAQGLNSVGQALGAGTSMFALSRFMAPQTAAGADNFSSASPVTNFTAPGGQPFMVNAPR